MSTQPKFLLNAMHTTTGGGLIYLQSLLPELAADPRAQWMLLAPQETLRKIHVPAGVQTFVAPAFTFWRGHVWEQLQLPFLARRWGADAMLCNANYVPLLARCAVPIIHTTPRAAAQALTGRMKLYWACLRALTVLSLYRARLAFTVAMHVVPDYVGPYMARKILPAYPAVALPDVSNITRDPNLVMTVGDFYPQKNYPLLVRAFALLRSERPTSRLVIVGRPVDPLVRDEVMKLVRELGIADAVTMTGAVPHDVLLKTLAKASVYINCSGAECFNMPVLEAMACGVPCVLGESVFQREVAGDAAVFVAQDKGGDIAAAFAVAMMGILENKPIADVLVRKGLERAQTFSWQATAAQIMRGMLAVVEGRKVLV